MYIQNIKRLCKMAFTSLVFIPTILLAADGSDTGVGLARRFMEKINEVIVYPLIMLMTAIAIVIFLYGALEFVRGASNETAREKGKKHLLYGTIGLLVMLSAYTILRIAAATFGFDSEFN